jgi:Ser/Thr protein kinase RdoA (MazF antagonist)
MEHYGLETEPRELASEVGQNFLLDASGSRYVLKVFNSDEDLDFLHAQVAALEHLRTVPSERPACRLASPAVVPRRDGPVLAPIRDPDTGEVHQVAVVTYIPGRPLAEAPDVPLRVLEALGRGLGDLDRRLSDFDHPSMRRDYRWDLARAPRALRWVEHIEPADIRDAVTSRLRRFETRVVPALTGLPHQVIHNDANDHNVLLRASDTGPEVSGLLDFGDMLWSARACEPAIAMAYAMLDTSDPVSAGSAVLSGYAETRPLEEEEVILVPDLIAARLCVSVTLSAVRRLRMPDNAYLLVSEAPARRLLDRMESIPQDRMTDAFLSACRLAGPSRR